MNSKPFSIPTKADSSTTMNLPDGTLRFWENFLSEETSRNLFDLLLKKIPWQEDEIKIFGKIYPQPRLTAFYGLEPYSYSYSSITMKALPFPREVEALRLAIESASGYHFNCCLMNLYRDGNDSNGWHADNEKELGEDPVIASLSLGGTRSFHLKHRILKEQRLKTDLTSGSLLLMEGPMQHHWLHQIPKTKKPVEARINLTFRRISEAVRQ